MSRSWPFGNERGAKIELVNGHAIVPGETFHKADIPWILWSVARVNVNTKLDHVELIMHKDPTTRITVSVDALTNDRYFRRVAPEV